MATESLSPNGVTLGSGWSGVFGSLTTVNATYVSAVEPDGTAITIDMGASAVLDADTVTKLEVNVWAGSAGTGTKNALDVEILIGGTPIGATQSTGNLSAGIASYNLHDATLVTGWINDQTAAEMDGIQVRLTSAQSGKNEPAATWEVDRVELITTYTVAPVGGGFQAAWASQANVMIGQ